MNKKYICGGGLIIILIIVGFFLLYPKSNEGQNENNVGNDYYNEEYILEKEEVSFKYKAGSDGYIIEDVTSFVRTQYSEEVVGAHLLMNAHEKEELDKSDEGREGPPTISLIIFKNTQNKSASQWIDSFPTISNMNLIIGTVDRDAVVGGANAVRYRTDGLYQNQNVAVAHGGYMYYFVGSFLEEDSDIFRDFNDLIDSVTFIPPKNSPQAKIDVRVACESALAYMTFPSGAEADIFVEDCIDGKYPEVIDKYISDMNLDGASI